MMMFVAAILLLVLGSNNASKYLHPSHHYHQEKDPYPPDTVESNEIESLGMLGRLSARLRSEGEEDGWEAIPDPRVYLLAQFDPPEEQSSPNLQDIYDEDPRRKRKGPSLSIVNPLEVLQEKWLMELSRRQKAGKIQRNRQILTNIGKRSVGAAESWARHDPYHP